MAVEGFGVFNAEGRDEKVIPSAHTAYRRFRFRPRSDEVIRAGNALHEAWVSYAQSALWVDPLTYDGMGVTADGFINRYADGYWQPCLTAAVFPDYSYKPGEHTASCYYFRNSISFRYHHDAPFLGCECGFWAYHTLEGTNNIGTNETCWMPLAAVEVWGRTVLGAKGVRAEKMKIVGLVTPVEVLPLPLAHPIRRAWDALVRQHDVPVYDNADDLVKAHPSKDVSHLLTKPRSASLPVTEDSTGYFSPGIPPTGITSVFRPFTPSGTPYWLPVLQAECCMCKYTFASDDQVDLDRMLAVHMLDKHMDWKAVAGK